MSWLLGGGIDRRDQCVLSGATNAKRPQSHMRLANIPTSDKRPILTDAALCTNASSPGLGQERDKIKVSFAKGLRHKIFQGFW